MAKQPAKPAIKPDRLYRIAFSKPFEAGGVKYIPRKGQSIKLRGTALAAVKDKVDSYEEI